MTSIFFNRNVPSKEIFVLDQNHLEKCQFFDYVGMTFLSFYSRTYKAGGRGGGGGDVTPPKGFSEFSLRGQNFST